MDSDIVGSILLQVVLIAVNAVFACAEIAVVSCNDAKLEKMAQEGNKKAAKLFRLTEQPSRFLATIQVVITLSGFLGSAFAAENFSGRFVSVLVDAGVQIPEKTLDAIAVVLITLLLSYITLIFGELVPKRLAMHNSEKIALGVSGLVTTASKIFAPLVGLLTVSTNGILRLFGIDPNEDDDQVTEEEIRMMVDAGSEKGTIDNEEKDMIQNVFEFDDLTIDEICALAPASIILSPGPGRPEQAGRCMEIVEKLGGEIPILGVCLGHQAICAAYGATVTYAKQLMHGKQSVTKLDTKTPLFVGLPEETTVARYHSLAAQEETFPECLQVTARTSDGEIMALQHKTKAVYGVQFHPESILTPLGKKMLENFIQLANAEKKEKTMIKEAIVKLAAKQNLDYETAEASMDEIMGGKASPVQMSAFLTAMAMKGETIEEITACAAGMRKHCVRLLHDQDVLEIVGTGGDHSNSFNISTTSSLVISAAGVPVAKHGNRAASSKSGAADVLEALGVKITIDPAKSAEVLKKIGLCFLFAQNYHLSMKYVAPVRKELGIRTIFNILGPLTNPAGANMELMGVYDEALVEPLARVLANLGVKKAMVVYGQDGLDEISMSAPTTVCEVKDGEFLSYVITPEQFGFTRCSKDELIGGSPQDNAQIALAILKGEKGPRRDAVVLNSAAAIHIAKGISIEDAIREAQEVIDSGKALAQLEQFAALTNQE